MQSTWHVDKVTSTERSTIAEITRVEWWKQNPDYTQLFDDDSYDGDMPDEFIVARPADPDAEMLVMGGSMSIDVTDEETLLLMAGDDVLLTIAVV